MKQLLFLFLSIFLFSSCEKTVKVGYNENLNPPILETDLNKSPKENVRQFIKNTGVDIKDRAIRISSGGKKCACAKFGKACYCQLSNIGIKSKSCGVAKSSCEKKKIIEIKVAPEEVDKLVALGFKRTS